MTGVTKDMVCTILSVGFSFQPVLHDCCNKGCGVCYPVWDAYKRTLAVNRKE